MSERTRRAYLDAVRLDVLGPINGEQEVLELRKGSFPRDQCVSGFISPDASFAEEAEQDRGGDPEATSRGDSDPGDAVSMASRRGPTSIGISFAIDGGRAGSATVTARVTGGFYSAGEERKRDDGAKVRDWSRRAFDQETTIDLASVDQHARVPIEGAALEWYVRVITRRGQLQATLVLCNTFDETPDRVPFEEHTLFQSRIEVQATRGCVFAPRPVSANVRSASSDLDTRANMLLYRDRQEWAVGHGSAATWRFAGGRADARDDAERPEWVASEWLPEQLVPAMTPKGDDCFARYSRDVTGDVRRAFSASELAGAESADDLRALLEVIPDAYEGWLGEQLEEADALEGLSAGHPMRETLDFHVERARSMVERMRDGIETICSSASARRAFQLSQHAMLLQLSWARPDLAREGLTWRPFQLGFILLTAAGIAGGESGAPHPDREVMDLLWFPTGGGKTEAYLGLAAFAIFHRRLLDPSERGAGVTVLMRYTLRLLTIQQFERAARLIIACDTLRMEDEEGLGATPISIGLWVGTSATPNTLERARDTDFENTKQLTRCPVCGEDELRWDALRPSDGGDDFVVACANASCTRGSADASRPLPVHTVDEMIYRRRPTLLIGTVDKFAQIVRKADAGALLRNDRHHPPGLIIQDELHLISGPLGTVTGLYEAAIDRICSADKIRPKIVGSTATIRRAEEQVRALFDREVCQFPPPVRDADNSCFARVDEDLPGRIYVGMTTAGKSPKFSLQHISGALLQRADTSEGLLDGPAEQDPYWTQLIYFNALRELGGALVMVHDDIPMTMSMLAGLHGTTPREGLEHLELSSRLGAIDIPRAIEDLTRPVPEQTYSVVLATNMISVGVDISRLGLMVVNGQPKGMSEYIQASSRVGRGALAGLVFTLYNAGRARDRSHYESFRSWHQALYSAVEATSVTPFSSRARDRALHACIVALARHVVAREHPRHAGLHDSPVDVGAARRELDLLIEELVSRGARAMTHLSGERVGQLRQQIDEDAHYFVDLWEANAPTMYWNDRDPSRSLLISAEEAAAMNWSGSARATPNSMREVEPSVVVRVASGLKAEGRTSASGTNSGRGE